MEKTIYKADQNVGKIIIVFAAFCAVALPFVVFSAFSYEPKEKKPALIETQRLDFDSNGIAIFKNYAGLSMEYMEGTSTGRTLSKYYARRQYPGSPPEIPHPVDVHGIKLECLACHADGGWTQTLKRMTPATPHAEQVSCMQCHVRPVTDTLFKVTDWQSVPPPRLGRSYLPGSPPPIPHDLQMRGNCIACHVGPGTVVTIRVEHASRGNCRQCHVPDPYAESFQRE